MASSEIREQIGGTGPTNPNPLAYRAKHSQAKVLPYM